MKTILFKVSEENNKGIFIVGTFTTETYKVINKARKQLGSLIKLDGRNLYGKLVLGSLMKSVRIIEIDYEYFFENNQEILKNDPIINLSHQLYDLEGVNVLETSKTTEIVDSIYFYDDCISVQIEDHGNEKTYNSLDIMFEEIDGMKTLID